MSLTYATKHVVRSWHLFLALLLGIILASAFFAGIDMKANVTTEQALDQQLSTVYRDMEVTPSSFSLNQLNLIGTQLAANQRIQGYEVVSRGGGPATLIRDGTNQSDFYTTVLGISGNSKVYDGWSNKPAQIGANETYIARNKDGYYSQDFLKVGDVVSLNITILNLEKTVPDVVNVNLTVKGFAQLDDAAYSFVQGGSMPFVPAGVNGQPVQIGPGPYFGESLLVDWNSTVKPYLEAAGDAKSQPFQQGVVIYVDRSALINAWDIEGSVSNLQVLQNSISNSLTTALGFGVSVQNNLYYSLQSFQGISFGLRLVFILISLPIFFMAWYIGTTVSDVSFNSRRREIGLLAIKGFSTSQVQHIFLIETILIGTVGSLLGVLLGFALVPLFASTGGALHFDLGVITPYTVIITVVFGILIAFLSTYASSKRAARLSTVSALREYIPPDEDKPIRRRLAWLALILGTYKIAVFISGVSVQALISGVYRSGNFILVLLGAVWLVIDQVLNYIGPLLFFWGFAKLFIQGSLKFQELTVRASKFLGDIGTLATKNVRRKPARAAAMAFLIALIVWYSVLVVGQLASERDFTTRQTYANVGADVVTNLGNVSQTQAVLNNILANVSEVQDASPEYTLYTQTGSTTLRAVDPEEWLKTAYYEDEWFSGASVQDAFNAMKTNPNTIILDRGVAKNAELSVGDSVSLVFENGTKALRVVGFFGHEPPSQPGGFISSSGYYWSYVPVSFYVDNNLTSTNSRILVKLEGAANGTQVANSILSLDNRVSSVSSVADSLQKSQSSILTAGALEVQELGIVFAVLAASVGTALISVVSMRERSREATILSVKGLSYKQLIIMFLTENLALVVFAVALGLSVGLISVYGNIASSNAQTTALVTRHLVFPLDSSLLVVGCVTLIFAATILPIIIMSRKYVTQLERMVRLR